MTAVVAFLSRYWLHIAVVAAIGGAVWHYQHLIAENSKLDAIIKEKKFELEQSQALIIKERQNAAEVALRAQKFYEQEAKDNEELEKLRACYADKSCWPRVRIKTSCPAMPGAASNAGALEEGTAELGEDAGRNLYRLRAGIKESSRMILSLQAELEARSKHDYCQPK